MLPGLSTGGSEGAGVIGGSIGLACLWGTGVIGRTGGIIRLEAYGSANVRRCRWF